MNEWLGDLGCEHKVEMKGKVAKMLFGEKNSMAEMGRKTPLL
ncbi:MAG: hypothetical protein WCS73_05440 [Lentisphaeria bacterium]